MLQARLARNRENAQLSRQRKKVAVQGLEQRCSELQAQNVQLTGLVGRLTAEVATLRFHLAAVCQQAGRPGPHVPPALAPCITPAAAGAAPARPLLPTPVGPVAAALAFRTPAPVAGAPGAPTVPAAFAPGAMPKVAMPTHQPAAPQRPPQQQAATPPNSAQQGPAAAAAAAAAAKGQKRARTAGRGRLAPDVLIICGAMSLLVGLLGICFRKPKTMEGWARVLAHWALVLPVAQQGITLPACVL